MHPSRTSGSRTQRGLTRRTGRHFGGGRLTLQLIRRRVPYRAPAFSALCLRNPFPRLPALRRTSVCSAFCSSTLRANCCTFPAHPCPLPFASAFPLPPRLSALSFPKSTGSEGRARAGSSGHFVMPAFPPTHSEPSGRRNPAAGHPTMALANPPTANTFPSNVADQFQALEDFGEGKTSGRRPLAGSPLYSPSAHRAPSGPGPSGNDLPLKRKGDTAPLEFSSSERTHSCISRHSNTATAARFASSATASTQPKPAIATPPTQRAAADRSAASTPRKAETGAVPSSSATTPAPLPQTSSRKDQPHAC